MNVPSVITHRFGQEHFILIQFVDKDHKSKGLPAPSSVTLADYVERHPQNVHAR